MSVLKAICRKCEGSALVVVKDHLEPCTDCKGRGWTFIEYEAFEKRKIRKGSFLIIDQGETISYHEFDSRNPA